MNGETTDVVLAAHAGATCFMCGLIWFVQVVHYPLMGAVPRTGAAGYAASHQRLTTFVVGPAMLLELACAVWLVSAGAEGVEGRQSALAWAGLGLLVGVWLSTALVQVPLHRRLAAGFDERAWRGLVRTNWMRTVLWSARAIVSLLMVLRAA